MERRASPGHDAARAGGEGRGRDCVATTVPSLRGLDSVPLLLPGTDVPGFPVSPLRGWRNSAVHFFAALEVATQTRGRPALHRCLVLVVVGVVMIHVVVVAATPLRFFKFFATLAR